MKYLKVKGLDKPISELVMGTAWFSPDCEPEIDEMLGCYIKEGGNVLDTGRFYGNGRSEGLLARWLERSGKRKDVVIIDKACHPFVDRTGKHYPEFWRVGANFITDDLMYSLNNVGVDYFDIYLMHRDDPNVPVSELIDRLEKHYQKGKIKVYGVSNWEIPRIEEAMDYAAKKTMPV